MRNREETARFIDASKKYRNTKPHEYQLSAYSLRQTGMQSYPLSKHSTTNCQELINYET